MKRITIIAPDFVYKVVGTSHSSHKETIPVNEDIIKKFFIENGLSYHSYFYFDDDSIKIESI